MIPLTILYDEYIGRPKLTEQKKTKPEEFRTRLEASKLHQKKVIATETIAFCCKILAHYFPRSDLKIGESSTSVTKGNKMQPNSYIENVS